jgi:hypothetical protein
MAVLLTLDLPVDRAALEAVSESMGVREDPPDGLIVHVLTEISDGVHVVDVWESEAAFQAFTEQRLMPALQAVLGDRGISLDPATLKPTFDDAFDLVRGR